MLFYILAVKFCFDVDFKLISSVYLRPTRKTRSYVVCSVLISFRDALGKPSTALEWDMKLWWPQNEAVIANRMAYEIFGEQKYKDDCDSLLEYSFKHFADPECGEWYGYLHYDNTVSNTLKGNIFKGPFHLPRMLMVLNAFEEGDFIKFFG